MNAACFSQTCLSCGFPTKIQDLKAVNKMMFCMWKQQNHYLYDFFCASSDLAWLFSCPRGQCCHAAPRADLMQLPTRFHLVTKTKVCIGSTNQHEKKPCDAGLQVSNGCHSVPVTAMKQVDIEEPIPPQYLIIWPCNGDHQKTMR